MIDMKLCVLMMMVSCVIVECNNRTKEMPGVCESTRRIPSVERRRPNYRKRADKVMCCTGWTYEKTEKKCKPVCRFGCTDGTCTAPDVCECAPPLMLSNNACVPPSCDPPCTNSDCVGINSCRCHEGFHFHNATHCIPKCKEGYINDMETLECKPVCETPCVNAICTDPDTCTCLPGYNSTNDSECVPECYTPCTNAKCTAPETCTCFPGYEPEIIHLEHQRFSDNYTCKPVCESHCLNGICVAPNTCDCLEGYVMEKGVCKPICDYPCNSGWCKEPNKCACFDFYYPDPNNAYNCLPSCPTDCVNGSCVSPNTCECDYGYEPINGSKYNCKPICKECVNGDCVSPNNCKCHVGFQKVGGVCKPDCTRILPEGLTESCVNGYCSAPNTCTCLDGYFKNSTSSYVCYKSCKGSCENGNCDMHGNCLCYSDFERKNDTCVPAVSKDCKQCDGNCTDVGCWCSDGTRCTIPLAAPEEIASSTSLAGLELTWMLGGAIGILLIVLVLVVIQRMWSKRKQYEAKAANGAGAYGSVVYSHTVPGTLVTKPADREVSEGYYAEVPNDREEPTSNDQLLGPRVVMEDEQL